MHIRCVFATFIGLTMASFSFGTAAWEAYVTTMYTSTQGWAYPISIPTNIPGSPFSIDADFHPIDIAITPDGTRALVIGCYGTDSSVVNVVDLSTPVIETTTLGGFTSPQSVAITPDGTRALVTDSGNNSICVLDLTRPTVTVEGWVSSHGLGAFGVAITPDGSRALVTNTQNGLLTVLTIGPTVQFSSTVLLGGSIHSTPWKIAITPNGAKALVTLSTSTGHVSVIDATAPTITAGYTVSVGNYPEGIAVSPDGMKAIVVNHGTSQNLNVLNPTLGTITSGYTVSLGETSSNVAITPDSARAYITIDDGGVYVFDLTDDPIDLLSEIAIDNPCQDVAITPDQAPTSIFTASLNDLTVSFDGSGSSSPVGTIAQYLWDFGDATPPSTTISPTTSHTYGSLGTYVVSLTVTNSAGTSLGTTFTGRTMSQRGLPRAQSTQTITAGWRGPTSFSGAVRLTDKNEVLLETRWSPTGVNVLRYEIFSGERKIADIAPDAGNKKAIRLHPRHTPHVVDQKYKIYLHNKYSIRGVAVWGAIGPVVKLEMD